MREFFTKKIHFYNSPLATNFSYLIEFQTAKRVDRSYNTRNGEYEEQ